jgi:hypothetical protein
MGVWHTFVYPYLCTVYSWEHTPLIDTTQANRHHAVVYTAVLYICHSKFQTTPSLSTTVHCIPITISTRSVCAYQLQLPSVVYAILLTSIPAACVVLDRSKQHAAAVFYAHTVLLTCIPVACVVLDRSKQHAVAVFYLLLCTHCLLNIICTRSLHDPAVAIF